MNFNFLGAVRSALPKKKYWLMSMDGGSSDQSGSSGYSESTDNKDACQASLMQILESQIIPSLLASNEFVEPFYSTDGARTALPTEVEIANFADLCTNPDEDAPDLFVQGLMAEGLSSENIFLHFNPFTVTESLSKLGIIFDTLSTRFRVFVIYVSMVSSGTEGLLERSCKEVNEST